MKYTNILLTILLFLTTLKTTAQQLDVTADLRMRYEYRHGFSTLIADTQQSANFVAQRSRLNIDYTSQHLKLRISPQNVRVWGDVATTAKSDPNNQLHEAWAELLVNNKFSFKAGRQELNYDDARILGNLDWPMQARSHDVLVTKINPDSINSFHIGLAANALRESNAKENYSIPNQYKAMQYLWYHGKFSKTGLSFLLMNQALPYMELLKEKVAWNQTFGPRLTYTNKSLTADAAVYLQTGKIAKNKLSAYYFSGNISYKTAKGFMPGIGFEYLSGKAGNDLSASVKSFTPWYGTNHKFNGFMDYFYVGNHSNSVGLADVYVNLAYENKKLKLKLTPHYFATAAALYKAGVKYDSYLGTEIDITMGYQVYENVHLYCGYSQMLASVSMEVLKSGSRTEMNNWAWVALHFTPKLFSFKTEAKK
jgi:hypothetical protein